MGDKSMTMKMETDLFGPVSLTIEANQGRFNLRVAADNVRAISQALGFDLPVSIGAKAQNVRLDALCLGPDEWVLHCDDSDRSTIAADLAKIYDQAPHSLVDVSDRESSILAMGEGASALVSTGCPIDLRDMPVGSGKRTIFDCAQIVLHRDGEEHFRIEVARSFAEHVWGLLNIANAELAAGL